MDEKINPRDGKIAKTELGAGPLKAEAVAHDRRIDTPACDIWEGETEFTILSDMPGVGKDGVTIDYEEGELKIYGKVDASGREGMTTLLNEFSVGDYSRVFRIPEGIDPERITAAVRDGVLKVTLPKLEKLKARKIAIE